VAVQMVNGAVIVCHGFGEHSGSYTGLTEHLGREGYVCAVHTQRGHGGLPREQLGVIPGYQSFLDDIAAIAAGIKKQMPGVPVILYGHSMGANIAANYLLQRGSSGFACAVLESPWFGHPKVSALKAGLAKAVSRVLPDMLLPAKDTKLDFADITSDREKQKEYATDPLYHNRMSVRLFSGINSGCAYALENASKLSVPTFLAIAEHECIVSNNAILRFYESCKDFVTLREYNCRHAIHNDVAREEFYSDVTAFLDKHCKGDSDGITKND